MKRGLLLLAILAVACGRSPTSHRLGTDIHFPNSGGSGSAGAGLGATPVCAAAVGNITLSGAQTVDGQSAGVGTCTVILAVGQTDQTTNGPYTANTGGAWTRIPTFSTAAQMLPGTMFTVLAGTSLTTGAGSQWFLSTTSPITVGTTALTFTQVIGSGALANQTLAQSRLTLAPQYVVQVVGASVQTVSLTGLNGNADGDYEILIDIVIGHAGATYALGTTYGNTSHYGTSFGTGGSLYITAAAQWILSANGGIAGTNFTQAGFLVTRVGIPRVIMLEGFTDNGIANAPALYGYSLDKTSNLTALTLTSSQTDGFAAGTFIQAIAKGRS